MVAVGTVPAAITAVGSRPAATTADNVDFFM